MATEAAAETARPAPLRRSGAGPLDAVLPVAVIVAILVVLWYVAAVALNAGIVRDGFERAGTAYTTEDLVAATLSHDRPLLPAPHQILVELKKTVVDVDPTSKRSLVYHGWVTLSSTLLGFVMGTILGIVLAVLIVHMRSLDKSLMPWIISSQTIPILAIAPIVIVVLGSIGLRGLVPKAIISTYLCFFPVTIGMVKGLTSPDVLSLDLMRTYSASKAQTFWKLRLPASVPFLFASLKVAIAIAIVGAIVAELPTGAQAGIGARLLSGSYYGQTVQIWAALFVAAALAASLVALVGVAIVVAIAVIGGSNGSARLVVFIAAIWHLIIINPTPREWAFKRIGGVGIVALGCRDFAAIENAQAGQVSNHVVPIAGDLGDGTTCEIKLTNGRCIKQTVNMPQRAEPVTTKVNNFELLAVCKAAKLVDLLLRQVQAADRPRVHCLLDAKRKKEETSHACEPNSK